VTSNLLPTDRLSLRPREAARALGISERSLWTLTKANEVPHTRLGKSVLYPVDALRRWLDARANGQGGGQ
jgi:excisionase family DNA binding protein